MSSARSSQLADLVLVDGDPLDLIYNLLSVRVVIKGAQSGG
jgi:hypothetical protein